MKILGLRVPMAFSLLLWFALWEVVGQARIVFLVPPFSEVLVAMRDLVTTSKFLAAAADTLVAFAAGMGLAIALGVAVGMAMGRVAAAERLLGMWVNVFSSAPLTALVPALMALIGFGQPTVIATVVLFAIWVIVLDTCAGVKHASPSLIDMARSFGAGRVDLYAKILVWAALPEILAGVRLGLIRGVKGVIIGQLLIAILGLGELFEVYSRNFLMAEFWALTVLVFAFALLLSEGVGLVERRIEYYARSRG
ncbi:MAG: ABC transporter permease [Pseudomonadota bacterium]